MPLTVSTMASISLHQTEDVAFYSRLNVSVLLFIGVPGSDSGTSEASRSDMVKAQCEQGIVVVEGGVVAIADATAWATSGDAERHS